MNDIHKGNEKINYIPCSFINTEEPPLKKSDYKSFSVSCQESFGDGKRYVVSAVRTYYYTHPECSEALITVDVSEELFSCQEGDSNFPAAYILLQAINNIKNFVKEI